MNNTDKEPPVPELYLMVKPEVEGNEGGSLAYLMSHPPGFEPKNPDSLKPNSKNDPPYVKRDEGLNLVTTTCGNSKCDACDAGEEDVKKKPFVVSLGFGEFYLVKDGEEILFGEKKPCCPVPDCPEKANLNKNEVVIHHCKFKKIIEMLMPDGTTKIRRID